MHLRRALLLFAIVLGLAAITASVSRPDEDSSSPPPPPTVAEQPEPTVEPGSAAPEAPGTLVLDTGPRERVRVEPGQPVTLEVSVDEPGLVEIPTLGLSAFGEPLTPARFEILTSDSGRLEVTFTPVDTDESEPAGTLVVAEPKS
ncbi:MAG: hypothetical protein ACRDM7_21380 [Thermoleophilaceae bacterium]